MCSLFRTDFSYTIQQFKNPYTNNTILYEKVSVIDVVSIDSLVATHCLLWTESCRACVTFCSPLLKRFFSLLLQKYTI
jgi:hypothetical protein